MGDRFYLPVPGATYPNVPDREVRLEDLGTFLKLSGTIVKMRVVGGALQGMGATYILLSDAAEEFDPALVPVTRLTTEEWGDLIRRTDDPEIFVLDPSNNTKVLQRKVRNAVSGQVQQKIWHRDGYRCVFCGREMGDVQLTIDHWVPLELGGANDPTNFLSACRKCNKNKGMMMPEAFCAKYGYNFQALDDYLKRVGREPL